MDPSIFLNMIVRPPKNDYNEPFGNGPKPAPFNSKFKVESFDVANQSGEILSCTFFEPANDADRSGDKMPCVIYMHGNAGNKTEAFGYAQKILEAGINFCCFDFSGCGNSEGEWVTLGHKEKHDLNAVIEYLQEF